MLPKKDRDNFAEIEKYRLPIYKIRKAGKICILLRLRPRLRIRGKPKVKTYPQEIQPHRQQERPG